VIQYRAYGLRIASELSLPELLPTDHDHTDVWIRFGAIARRMAPGLTAGATWSAVPGQALIQLDQLATFLVVDGREIWIERAASSSDDDIRVFLLGSALAALLLQRGVLTMHASAIHTGHGAVIFLGRSGSGKSTLLTALVERGYAMLADDLTGVLHDARQALVLPALPATRLWSDALSHLKRSAQTLLPVRSTLAKYQLPIERFWPEPVALHAAYLLTTHNQPGIRLLPLAGIERVAAWNQQTYRRMFLHGLGLRQAHFATIARLAQRIPLSRVVRPDRLAALDELVAALEADFS
jgi:hypothetical protein